MAKCSDEPEFLSLSIIDILGRIIFCCGTVLLQCRMFVASLAPFRVSPLSPEVMTIRVQSADHYTLGPHGSQIFL